MGGDDARVQPQAISRLARWWAPEQASMPISQDAKLASNSSNLARGPPGRTNSGLLDSSTPRKAKTFLARSIPMEIMVMISALK